MSQPTHQTSALREIRLFFRDIFSGLWHGIEMIFRALWSVILKILEFVSSLLKIVATFIRAVFFGVSVMTIAFSILILSLGSAFYLVSKAIGLSDSPALQNVRDLLIRESSEEFLQYHLGDVPMYKTNEDDRLTPPHYEIPKTLPEALNEEVSVEPENETLREE